MPKFVTAAEAADLIFDGATIMMGGFMAVGSALQVIDALAEKGTKNLTLIGIDAATTFNGPMGENPFSYSKLIRNRQVKHLIATHIGLNPECQEMLANGEIEVTLVPQGSLAEMIRAGGSGLGGVVTPTGVGTVVENAWHVDRVVEIDGKKYLLEKALKADFALLSGYKVDKMGNVWYKGTTRSLNVGMAMAAETVIMEADNIVEVGEILPEDVVTSGILVDYVVKGGAQRG